MNDFFHFCSIDENGMVFDHNKDPLLTRDQIHSFFDSLQVEETFQITARIHDQTVLVEAYDAPIVANEIKLSSTHSHELINAYGIRWDFELSSLLVDEWDRFHGMTNTQIPFVMNRQAQNQFFDQLDQFDDDSFSYRGRNYTPDPYWITEASINQESYWTQKYQNNEAGWDLGEPAMGLQYLLPKLKLPASRVLVLGGGNGHDAAHFAQQGHHVTQVDISPAAIAKTKTTYGHLNNLNLIEGDIFNLPVSMYNQYDLIFEHTCFCAIDPHRREDLIKQWRRLLHSNGTFLGIFFTMPKRIGPPFGASEWELKHHLQNSFQTLVWQRLRHSIKPRLGRELLVYLQRKAL